MITKPDWTFGPQSVPEQGTRIKLATRICATLGCLNILVVIAAPVARLFLDLQAYPAFLIFFYALQFGLLLALSGLILVVIALFHRIGTGWKRGIWCMVLGILPLVNVIIVIGPDKIGKPMIHDVTTDTDDPPDFSRIKSMRSAEQNTLEYGGSEIADKQLTAYPDLHPVITSLDGDGAMARSIKVCMDLGWQIINADYDTGIVEASDTTRIFGFTDDIVIRIRVHGTGSRVDIRSVSRIGLGDMGKNAERIRQFMQAFGS